MKFELIHITDAATSASVGVALYRYGSIEKPVVLCVHGLTRNAADFHFLAENLAADFHVWCIDIPGRANSPRLNSPKLYNNAFYASLIVQWLESIKPSPMHFIGTSMGGIIGMILAATKPKLLRSIILNDVGSLIPASETARLKEYVGVNTSAAIYEELAARTQKNLAQFGIRDAGVMEHFVKNSIEADGAGGFRMNYDPAIRESLMDLGDKDVSLSLLWKAVKCPTLIIRGANSNLLPESVAMQMLQKNNKSALYTVDEAGHAPSLSTPEEISLIKHWLLQTTQNNA